MKNTLAALLLLLPAAALASVPSEIAAEYRLSVGGITIGRVAETFVHREDRYSIRSVSTPEGPLRIFMDDELVLESSGKVNASGLQPLAFAQRRTGSPQRDIRATFDWERGIMHSSTNPSGPPSEVPLPPDTQDRISVMYQFMNLRAAAAAKVSMYMSNGRKVELYTYRLVDEARIATGAGTFDTLHYQRIVDNPKDNHVDVWLARDRFNFPVRVIFDDPKGLRVEQTLVALRAQ